MRYISYALLAVLLVTSVSAYHSYHFASPYSTPYYHQYSYGYDNYGGYRVTHPGPYPYPPTYRYVEDRLLTGHYSGVTGRYHAGYTGRMTARDWYGYGQSNAVPARFYPEFRTVHFE